MEIQSIQQKIYEVRGYKVMFDFDLAILYEVETRMLKQAVKRNRNRFPNDFMFILTEKEVEQMVSQNVIPSKSYFGGALPFAFTEHGVAMLASVLRSQKAVKTNIAIIRAFISLREIVFHYKKYEELEIMIKELEAKNNEQFTDIYKVLNVLLEQKKQQEDFANRERIGFKFSSE